jgi:hypothetical protein
MMSPQPAQVNEQEHSIVHSHEQQSITPNAATTTSFEHTEWPQTLHYRSVGYYELTEVAAVCLPLYRVLTVLQKRNRCMQQQLKSLQRNTKHNLTTSVCNNKSYAHKYITRKLLQQQLRSHQRNTNHNPTTNGMNATVLTSLSDNC